MFAALLPGIRDVRTPLTVGLLWVATAWVWWAELFPNPDEASGLFEQFYRISGAFGTVVATSVVTFAGYIIGILLSPLHFDWRPVRQLLPPPFRTLSWQSRSLYLRRQEAILEKVENARQRLEEAIQRGTDLIHPSEMHAWRRNLEPRVLLSGPIDIEADIRLMSMRLQSTNTHLYDDYDRFKSEAEFRRSIALPLSVLTASIYVHLVPTGQGTTITAIVLGLALTIVLHVLSWRKSREGNDLIIQSLEIDQVSSPTIEALEAGLESIEKMLTKPRIPSAKK